MNLKTLFNFKERNYGSYVTFALGLLLLVTGIVYAVNFQDNFILLRAQIEFNVAICVLLFVGAILTIGLNLFAKTSNYAQYVAGVIALTVFCLFVLDTYMFMANCLIDIDYHPDELVNPVFLVPLIFVAISFVVGIAGCFFPQLKEAKKEECSCSCCACEEETKEETVNE